MRAMILAAGRGERMRPLTDTTPKALLKIANTCMIDYHLARIRKAGISEVVINLGHLGAMIREHLKDGQDYGVQIHYSDEGDTLLETAGGIIKALPMLGDEPFFVVNTDVYTDYTIQDPHLTAATLGHLIMVDNPRYHRQGDFGLDANRLHHNTTAKLTFSGMAYYQPALFKGRAPERLSLAELLQPMIAAQLISGEHYQGVWMDVGTIERLDAAQAERLTHDTHE